MALFGLEVEAVVGTDVGADEVLAREEVAVDTVDFGTEDALAEEDALVEKDAMAEEDALVEEDALAEEGALAVAEDAALEDNPSRSGIVWLAHPVW